MLKITKIIGVPKEIKIAEARVALTPDSCLALTQQGLEVWVESNAGQKAGFEDEDYQKAGAQITESATELFEKANLIIKVKEPQKADVALLKSTHTLFCYLHLGGNTSLIQELNHIGLEAYAFETLILDHQTPLLKPMSAIAGRLAVQFGAEFLHSVYGGRGTLLGGTSQKPAGNVLVLGAGVAGVESAILAANMGAKVTILDISEDALAKVQALDPRFEAQINSPELLEALLPTTDLLIGAVYVQGKTAPHVVSKVQVQMLPQGAVVVDISIDQGGCIETSKPCTHKDPFFVLDGILHSAITNLPAAVPRSASLELSHAIAPYVAELAIGKHSLELKSALNVMGGKLILEL